MNETRTLWQRCEALGPMEDQGVQLYRTDSGDYRIFIDRATVFHVHQDGTIGDYCRAWLGEAILQRFEAITGKESFPLPVPVKLPDVTYVVEAPKPTEPTQEQLKAIWDHVTHLTMEQETRLGIQYVFVGAAIHSEFQLHIKSVASCKDQWRVRIAQGSNGVFRAIEPFNLALACHRLGCFHVSNSEVVTESPLQFVSIPVTEWQKLREAHKTIQSILFPEIKDIEFES